MESLLPTTSMWERCLDVKGRLQSLHSAVREKSQDGLTITVEDVGDQLERFLLWAGNLGALKNPNSKLSLDSRLSDAPEMREHILRQLSDIDKAVEALQGIVSCESPNRQIQDSTSTFWLGNDNAERPAAEPPTPGVGDDQDDEARMKLGIISKSISMLFSIAIMVRKAGKQDQFFKALQKAEAHQPKELFPDTYDINHVRHKHPKLVKNELESVANSLGRAITKRRQFIKYRREHVGRLGVNDYQKPSLERPQSKTPVKQQPGSQGASSKAQTAVFSSKASTFPEQIPAPLLGTGARTPVVDMDDDEDVDDNRSAQASTATAALADLKLPRLESMAKKNEEFICPFCFSALAFSGETAWRTHALSDLKPYVCTMSNESCQDLMFDDVDVWFNHELKHHRSHYVCILCREGPMADVKELHSHLLHAHRSLDVTQFSSFEEPGRQVPESFTREKCPFCYSWADSLEAKYAAVTEHHTAKTTETSTVSLNKFKKHLAVHQEQLAIFATPREIGNDARDSESSKSSLPALWRDRLMAYVLGAEQTHATPDPAEVDTSNFPQDREDTRRNQQEEEYSVDERYPMHSIDFTGDQSLVEFYSILEKTRGYSTAFAYHKNKRHGYLMSSTADPKVPLVIESLSKFNLEPWKNGVRPRFPMFSLESIPMLLSEACVHNDSGYFNWAWSHHLVLYPNRNLDDIVWRHMTMLITAVNAGTADMVKLCIELGANPNARWNGGMRSALPPIIGLIRNEEPVAFDTDEDAVEDETGLHLAAVKGDLDITKILVKAGADLHAETKEGRTALWLAASNGHLEVVDYLISAGADTEAADADGTTPWEAAVQSGHDEVVLRLSSVEGEDNSKIVDGIPLDGGPAPEDVLPEPSDAK